MSEMEERLKAALAARADQVREEDLTPLPGPHEHRAWWRTPRHWLPLTAVAAIVIAIPLVAQQLVTSEPDPGGPAGPPSGSGQRSLKGDALETPGVVSGAVGDFDGDGRTDTVRVVGGESTGRVTVRVRGGSTATWDAPLDRLPISLVDATDVDGHGGDEVLVETGSRPRVLVVLTLVADGNGLAVLSDREVRSGTGPEGFRHDWWVDDGRLVSTVSVRPVTRDGGRYEVDVVRWEPRQGLSPVELGRYCVRDARPKRLFASCDEIDPRTLPAEHGGL